MKYPKNENIMPDTAKSSIQYDTFNPKNGAIINNVGLSHNLTVNGR